MKNILITQSGRPRVLDRTRGTGSLGVGLNGRSGKMNKRMVRTEHKFYVSIVVKKYGFQTMGRYL